MLKINTLNNGYKRLIVIAIASLFILTSFVSIALKLAMPAGASASYWSAAARTTSGSRNWVSIDSSADGTKLVAAVSGGYVFTSSDSGATWNQQTTSGSRSWKSVASSSDGTRLVAAVATGYIYTSSDSGATWNQRASSRNWVEVDSSADGMKLIAAVAGTSGNRYIYTSTDTGVNWTEVTNRSSQNWTAAAISPDGSTIAVADGGSFSGRVFVSRDGGENWETGFGYRDWSSIAISADGTKLIAVSSTDEQFFTYHQGAEDEWEIDNLAGNAKAVTMSANGNRVAVAMVGGEVKTSNDYGDTWSTQSDAGTKNWSDVTLSSDGLNLAASAANDYIYTGLIYLSTNAPTNLVGVAGDAQVVLTWTVPSDDGGAAISDYKVAYSSDGGSNWSEYSHSASTATTQTVTGLQNGYEYIFRVSAINIAGEGEASSIITARPNDGSIVVGPAQTITVTTNTDEDSGGATGAGCSLREAIIASNTTQPYGGCAAGGGNEDTIYLPNATYNFGYSASPLQYVYNASIVGESTEGTIVSNLSFMFAGDTVAGISNLTLSSNGPGADVTIIGSHKSIRNVTSRGNVPVLIFIGNQGHEIIGTTISSYVAEGTAPATPIQCTAKCSGTVLEDSTLHAQQAVPVSLGDGATVTNLTGGAMYAVQLTVGEDSVVSGVELAADPSSGSSNITLGAGSVLENSAQTSGSNVSITGSATRLANISQAGGNVNNYFAAEEVDGFSINAISSMSFGNTSAGSQVKNLAITTSANSNNIDLKASLIEGIGIVGDTASNVYFYNTYDGATLSDISFDGVNGLNMYITGNDLTMNDIRATTIDPNSLNVTGANPAISDVNFVNMGIRLTDPESALLERISLVGSNDSSGGAIALSGLIGDVVIKDSSIVDPYSGGIEVYASAIEDTSVRIQNTQMRNAGTSAGSYGALAVYNVNQVTVDGVTISGGVQQNVGAIYIIGGTNHSIVNTTVVGANGGVMFANSGSGTDVTVNNSTIVNNTAVDLSYGAGAGLSFNSISDEGLHATVTNSIIAGNTGDQCTFTSGPDDLTVVTAHDNITSDLSCGTGFTVVDDVADVVESTLADNDAIASSIGYLRQSGKVQTLALTSDSPALATGDQATCAPYDARGFERDLEQGCDIGAYQFGIVVTLDPDPDPDPSPDPDPDPIPDPTPDPIPDPDPSPDPTGETDDNSGSGTPPPATPPTPPSTIPTGTHSVGTNKEVAVITAEEVPETTSTTPPSTDKEINSTPPATDISEQKKSADPLNPVLVIAIVVVVVVAAGVTVTILVRRP